MKRFSSTFSRVDMPRLVLFVAFVLCAAIQSSSGVEIVQFEDSSGDLKTATGKILIEAQDGGMMLCGDDGMIWTLQPEQIKERKSDDQPFTPIDADEMEKRVLAEVPAGFSVYQTNHYIIVYNSDEAYAKIVAGLFEQLYRGFFTYWKNLGWEQSEPEFPLVAVVLRDTQAFRQYAGAEIGARANEVIGYYHLATNRMTTYRVPNLERNVSTIIHEATHQLAYNCGMQRRFADNPMWVSEGLATFFEAPDRRNPTRWRNIGRVNGVNLTRWRKYVRNRPEESLATLLANDTRYENQASAEAAYAEGWALTYFLIKTKKKQYVEYMKQLSEGKPLAEKPPRQRIDEFEAAFGMKLTELDKAFVSYLRRVR
ncbi:MAG: DUF1570 domain-containing protein [Rubripirellula sp.]